MTPASKVCISTINCHEVSGCIRMGVEVKHVFNSVKAVSTLVVQ